MISTPALPRGSKCGGLVFRNTRVVGKEKEGVFLKGAGGIEGDEQEEEERLIQSWRRRRRMRRRRRKRRRKGWFKAKAVKEEDSERDRATRREIALSLGCRNTSP